MRLEVGLHFTEEGLQRATAVLCELAADEIERLDAVRALVDHGNPSVAYELLHTVFGDVAVAAKYLLGGFLILISASMVTYLIPGFGTAASGDRSGVIATVAGEDIKTDEVNRVVQSQMRQQKVAPEMAAPEPSRT